MLRLRGNEVHCRTPAARRLISQISERRPMYNDGVRKAIARFAHGSIAAPSIKARIVGSCSTRPGKCAGGSSLLPDILIHRGVFTDRPERALRGGESISSSNTVNVSHSSKCLQQQDPWGRCREHYPPRSNGDPGGETLARWPGRPGRSTVSRRRLLADLSPIRRRCKQGSTPDGQHGNNPAGASPGDDTKPARGPVRDVSFSGVANDRHVRPAVQFAHSGTWISPPE